MKSKGLFLILAAPALLLAGCGKSDSAKAPVRVRLERTAAISGLASSYYSGTIEAFKDIPLSFQTGGTVAEVLVREGQSVEKGGLLAELDCRNNENALKIAEAKSKQADDAYSRFEPMYKNGNLPQIKMVEIETGKVQAAAAFKMASKNTEDCRINAPESGMISRRDAEPGSSAIPGKTVLDLVVVDQVYASISVPEQEISGIKAGSWATVEVAALTPAESRSASLTSYRDTPAPESTKLRGIVTDSGITADPLARTYTVRVLLKNPGRRILPGMICSVYTGQKSRAGLTLVPATAVNLDDDGRQYVYTVAPKENIARKRFVETSGFAKGGVIVQSGLNAGETVVSEGAQKLSDGTAVEADEAYAN